MSITYINEAPHQFRGQACTHSGCRRIPSIIRCRLRGRSISLIRRIKPIASLPVYSSVCSGYAASCETHLETGEGFYRLHTSFLEEFASGLNGGLWSRAEFSKFCPLWCLQMPCCCLKKANGWQLFQTACVTWHWLQEHIEFQFPNMLLQNECRSVPCKKTFQEPFEVLKLKGSEQFYFSASGTSRFPEPPPSTSLVRRRDQSNPLCNKGFLGVFKIISDIRGWEVIFSFFPIHPLLGWPLLSTWWRWLCFQHWNIGTLESGSSSEKSLWSESIAFSMFSIWWDLFLPVGGSL